MRVVRQSLRARLLVYLGVAVALVAGVQATMAYRTALAEADAVFDYHMQQAALSLRNGLPLDPDADISELAEPGGHHGEEVFDFVVQIWSAEGQLLYRSTHSAELPDRAVMGFSSVPARGSTYRVFSLQTPNQVIQVAQDMAVRRHMARTLALRTIAPMAWLVPLLLASAWWVVGSTLAPLQRLRRQLARRRDDDLAPLGQEGALPDEIRPLVHELNGLFGRLQQSFVAQQRFVADAAHELRSPLAALKLQVQGLARATDDAARQRAVQRLDAGIERATHLVDQLLLLARQEEGIKPQRRALRLMDVLRLALADLAPAAQQRDIDLGLLAPDATAGPPPDAACATVEGDAAALRVLLRNLLDNAVKYTPLGGRVDVSLQRRGGLLCLQVEDSGPGIAEAERERVFDRFYRVPGAEAPGNGLGLAIVKAIADGHGGTLALGRSERLGGLRVDLCLPCAPDLRPA